MRKKKQFNWIGLIAPLCVLAVILAVCELAARSGRFSANVLPVPSQIFTDVISKFRSKISEHFLLTMKVILTGFAAATFLGVLLAALIAQSGLVKKAISPVIIGIVIIPMIALIPVMMLWFGYNLMQRIYVVIIQATPIITLNALNGFIEADTEKTELSKSLGCNKLHYFINVTFMNALPRVFTGIKLGCINVMIAALSADAVAGNIGMGYIIGNFVEKGSIDLAYGSIILVALVGFALYNVIGCIEHKVVFWKTDGR